MQYDVSRAGMLATAGWMLRKHWIARGQEITPGADHRCRSNKANAPPSGRDRCGASEWTNPICNQHVRHKDTVAFDVATNEALQRRIRIRRAVTATQNVARRTGFQKYCNLLTLAATRKRTLFDASP